MTTQAAAEQETYTEPDAEARGIWEAQHKQGLDLYHGPYCLSCQAELRAKNAQPPTTPGIPDIPVPSDKLWKEVARPFWAQRMYAERAEKRVLDARKRAIREATDRINAEFEPQLEPLRTARHEAEQREKQVQTQGTLALKGEKLSWMKIAGILKKAGLKQGRYDDFTTNDNTRSYAFDWGQNEVDVILQTRYLSGDRERERLHQLREIAIPALEAAGYDVRISRNQLRVRHKMAQADPPAELWAEAAQVQSRVFEMREADQAADDDPDDEVFGAPDA